MPAYLGGTVWVQVVPSFNGLQGSIRKGVGDAFAGAGIEKASADAFKGVEKNAGAAGEKSAKAFANSFQKLTSDRIKRIGKDFEALRHDTSLVGKEFTQIRAVLNDIAKHDLTTVTGQGQATQDMVALRRQLQGMLDDADRGQRQLSDPARWGLGAIRGQFDEIGKTIQSWTAPDPQAVKWQQDQQKMGKLRLQAEREMTAELARRREQEQRAGQMQERAAREMSTAERKRMVETARAYDTMQRDLMRGVKDLDQNKLQAHRAEVRALREQFALEQNRAKLRASAAKAEAADSARQIRVAKVLADFSEQRRVQAERAQAALQRFGTIQSRAQRQNFEIDAQVDRSRIRAQMKAIADELRTLSTDISVGADTDEANAKIASLRARLAQLDRDRVNIDVEVDTLGAMLQLRRLESQISSASRSGGGNFMALLDAGSAANSVRVFNGVLFTTLTLGPLLIPVLAAVAGGIFGIGAAALGAVLGVGTLVAGLAGIGGAVGAMSDLDRARREQRGGAGSTRDAAAARRQAIQDARAVADAQQTLSRARRDGARAIADANRQVIDAEQELSRAHEDAAEAAQEAAERVSSAREAAQRAAQDAARAAQDASRRVRDAEQGLIEAQRNAVEVQEDLNAARRQAVRDLQDLKNQLDSAKLNEQDLAFQVEEANVHLNVVLEDDQATDREKRKAQLRYDQAVEALEQQQLETKRLTVDQKAAAAAGVEGSDRVKDAKDRISDANERVKDAEQAVADARAAQDRQAVDSALALRDARDAVTDALRDQGRVAQDNAERINDAERALADARVGRNDAQLAAAESIADAEQGVARAHEDITLRGIEAATATDELATATDNLNESLRNLSPAGVAFATFLYGLAPLLRDIRFAAQEGLLPGLQEGLSAIVNEYGPSFVAFIGDMAHVLGDLSSEFGMMLTEDETWREFFSMMNDLGPTFLRQFGDVSINLLTAFASIMTAFAPFIAEMGDGLVGLTEDFADWAASLEGSSALQDFFEYLRDSGPVVGELIGNISEILKDLFIGLAPYADDLLDSLVGFTDWLADMEPDEIANLALGIGGVVLAFQALAGAMALITGPLGLIGGAITFGRGVGGAISGAAAKGGGRAAVGAAPATAAALDGVSGAGSTLGKRMLGIAGPIGIAVGALWLIYDAALWLDKEFNLFGGNVEKFGDIVGAVFTWWWEEIISPVWDLISGVLTVMGEAFGILGNMIGQIFRFVIAPVFNWLWDKTIGPWWEDKVQPLLNAFGTYVKENLPEAIQAGANLIGSIWQGVLNLLRAPIKAAIDIVFNKGIIGSFNWLADKVPGMDKIAPIDIPASLFPNGSKPQFRGRHGGYATGGILPGYTPGIDVHRFISPTGGVLDLSGGEPILRPEAGKVLGPGWVHGINAAARGGGTGGVQRFLGGHEAHADGGFFGDVLDKLKGFGSGFTKAITDPLGFFDGVVDKSLGSWGVGGLFGDIIGPMVKGIPSAIADWIGGMFSLGGGKPGGKGGGVPAGAMGWQLMWNLVSSQFPHATLNSAFRPGAITAVGTPSYHGLGRAIDITPDMDIFNWLLRTFSNATELIFSPAGSRQLWNGNPYFFGEPTRGDHWDHIHWAMANGGIIPSLYDDGGDVSPGMTLVANRSGKVESTVTDRFMEEVRALGRARGGDAPVVDARGSNFYDATPEQIVDEWSQRRHDQLALSGLLDEPGV